MDPLPNEHVGFWGYIIAAVVVPVVTALVGAIAYMTKRFCHGFAYYVRLSWLLVERLAEKHFQFLESVDTNLQEQSKSLAAIETSTAETSEQIAAFGSDPVNTLVKMKEEIMLEFQEAIKTHSEEAIDRVVQKVMQAMMAQGLPCSETAVKKVLLENEKKYEERIKARN